jgi:hypothetical protein
MLLSVELLVPNQHVHGYACAQVKQGFLPLQKEVKVTFFAQIYSLYMLHMLQCCCSTSSAFAVTAQPVHMLSTIP